MDVVSLHQSGIENVVASSGTSLTTEQIKLIKRLTENVTILFDGDKAGIKASFRSIDMLLSEGMNIRVLLFPDGDDPDSFARKHPQEYVENFIDKEAKDFIDFKAEILLKDAGNDPIKKAESIRDIVKSVAFVQNGLKREVYLKEVSNKFGLSEQSLFNELQIQTTVTHQQESKPKFEEKKFTPKLEIVQPTEFTVNPLLLQEEKLVDLMLKYGDFVLDRKDVEGNPYKITVIEEILNHLEEDECEIQLDIHKKIISEIKEGILQNEIRSGNFFFNMMDEEVSGKLANALIENYHTSNWNKFNIYFSSEEEVVPKLVSDIVLRHKREYIVKLINDLKNSLTEQEDGTQIYQQIMLLTQLKNKLDSELFRIL